MNIFKGGSRVNLYNIIYTGANQAYDAASQALTAVVAEKKQHATETERYREENLRIQNQAENNIKG